MDAINQWSVRQNLMDASPCVIASRHGRRRSNPDERRADQEIASSPAPGGLLAMTPDTQWASFDTI